MANTTTIDQNFNGKVAIIITHKTSTGYELIKPIVEDGIKWETERQGSPGKLTFKVYDSKNNGLNIQEGDGVTLRYSYTNIDTDYVNLFMGYVFTKKRDKDGWINITAYDLLRYLKNKSTYVYKNKKASDVVKMIANDFKLDIGAIESTSYVIGERVEDNQSLFDIIQNAIDLTLIHTNKQYVLYADRNKLYLSNIMTRLSSGIVITNSSAENFDYTSSIDEETYNEIELYYDNKETNKREYYHAADARNIGSWGILKHTEQVQSTSNIKDRVKQMLNLYNRKTKKLSVKNAFGNIYARGGTLIPVQLNLGDIVINNNMVIEKATHTFSANEYRMDLTLSDGVFTA